jgi:hypothetical protein
VSPQDMASSILVELDSISGLPRLFSPNESGMSTLSDPCRATGLMSWSYQVLVADPPEPRMSKLFGGLQYFGQLQSDRSFTGLGRCRLPTASDRSGTTGRD